jgi:hypothetical protein
MESTADLPNPPSPGGKPRRGCGFQFTNELLEEVGIWIEVKHDWARCTSALYIYTKNDKWPLFEIPEGSSCPTRPLDFDLFMKTILQMARPELSDKGMIGQKIP